ncbi:major facilitator transporter [Rhodanobacter sp. 115]|nr:major facilitator transporter [Rhodanobacter sp. 115]
MLSVGLLGFSSGLPLALSGSTLQAWFTTAGMSLRDIGWITLIGSATYSNSCGRRCWIGCRCRFSAVAAAGCC